MYLQPFLPERQIGVVSRIEGKFIDVSLEAADRLPQTIFGEHVGRGEVGEFVIVDVGGLAVFGRVEGVGYSSTRGEARADGRYVRPVEGRVQLLSTVHLDGVTKRGIEKYPRLGDLVYAASSDTVTTVISGPGNSEDDLIALGRLSMDSSLTVSLPLGRVFGRHLAIVGSTGSGKSWSLAHLAESIVSKNGKMILLDATGEFSSLGDVAEHVAFSSLQGEPEGAQLVGVPHYMMREADLIAFLNPSAGTQLPKLREAIRSLRLAWAIRSDENAESEHTNLISEEGTIPKFGRPLRPFYEASKKYSRKIHARYAPYDLKVLSTQIQNECVFPVNDPGSGPTHFGKTNTNEMGYVASLVSRVNDLVRTPEIMEVIDPPDDARNLVDLIKEWLRDRSRSLLRISLRNLTFDSYLREILVNILGQQILEWARSGLFQEYPLIVAIDEAHQFFDVSVGDDLSSTRLNAFDLIAKEGRKYGLTVCLATQRPGDLPAGVLSQVGMKIVHRLGDGRDRIRVEQAATELDHSATKLLPGLVPGEALLMGVDFPIPMSLRMLTPARKPISDGPNFGRWAAS